ncbi:Poly(U)-binding-splicing factor puf60 [Podila epigama]|nr:Poly(U)-binding-splicing factor puf60 [Podila epigama]
MDQQDSPSNLKRSSMDTETPDLEASSHTETTSPDNSNKKAKLDDNYTNGDANGDISGDAYDNTNSDNDNKANGATNGETIGDTAMEVEGNADKEMTDATAKEEKEPRDPETGLSETMSLALQRAKQFARELQEEAGSLTSATEPEPSLAIANIAEQQKAMHILCRVYVGSISFEATEDDVRKKLSRFGPIKELALKVDPLSGKHRGFCFVEYDLPEAAIVAVQASDSVEVVGRHLKIGRPKNFEASAVSDLPTPPESRLYVANIGSLVSEQDLSGIFKAFGEVEQCILVVRNRSNSPDFATRQHKGYGYVQFKAGTNVDIVVESMKGFTLLDTPMGVCKAIIGGPIPEGMKALDSAPITPAAPPVPQARPAASVANPVNPAMIARATATAASTAQRLVAMQHQNGGMGYDRESVASEENMSISGNQRYLVMQSLARSAGGNTAAGLPTLDSTVVRLQYNATPADIDDQLEEEFSEECSKYGPVVRVQMLPLADGLLRIFIQFGSAVDAKSAAMQLNGRQFDGKKITASLFDRQEYLAGRLV